MRRATRTLPACASGPFASGSPPNHGICRRIANDPLSFASYIAGDARHPTRLARRLDLHIFVKPPTSDVELLPCLSFLCCFCFPSISVIACHQETLAGSFTALSMASSPTGKCPRTRPLEAETTLSTPSSRRPVSCCFGARLADFFLGRVCATACARSSAKPSLLSETKISVYMLQSSYHTSMVLLYDIFFQIPAAVKTMYSCCAAPGTCAVVWTGSGSNDAVCLATSPPRPRALSSRRRYLCRRIFSLSSVTVIAGHSGTTYDTAAV